MYRHRGGPAGLLHSQSGIVIILQSFRSGFEDRCRKRGRAGPEIYNIFSLHCCCRIGIVLRKVKLEKERIGG